MAVAVWAFLRKLGEVRSDPAADDMAMNGNDTSTLQMHNLLRTSV